MMRMTNQIEELWDMLEGLALMLIQYQLKKHVLFLVVPLILLRQLCECLIEEKNISLQDRKDDDEDSGCGRGRGRGHGRGCGYVGENDDDDNDDDDDDDDNDNDDGDDEDSRGDGNDDGNYGRRGNTTPSQKPLSPFNG